MPWPEKAEKVPPPDEIDMTYSLRTLLAAMVFAALFFAAFTIRTPLWASIVATTAFAVFIIATSRLVLNASSRAFMLPFCLTGWLYLAIAFVPSLSDARRSLITTQLLGRTFAWIKQGQPAQFVKNGYRNIPRLDDYDAVNLAVEPFEPQFHGYYHELRAFFHVGDCLSALLMACLMGTVVAAITNAPRRVA